MAPATSLILATTAATDATRVFAFTCITDTVISALAGGSNLTNFAGVTLPAGFTFYVAGLTSITLASGSIVLYKLAA